MSAMLLGYTILQKVLVFVIERKKNPFIHFSGVSNLNYALLTMCQKKAYYYHTVNS